MQDKKAFWLWLLQRITAGLLFVILLLHIYFVHYKDLGQPILFNGIAIHLSSLIFYIADSSLLILGLFHGLNGLRMVLLDFEAVDKYEKWISWSLLIVGIIFSVIGVKGLWAFIIK